MRDLDNIFLEQRIHELEKNGTGGGSSADKISYNNSESGLTSNTVQGAIDEVHEEVENIRHHYSTEEKVVGEWVDGSLIYEKTITNINIPRNDWNNSIDITDLNVKNVINMFGRCDYTDSADSTMLNTTESGGSAYFSTTNPTKITLYQNQHNGCKAFITLQYTKNE